MREPLRKQGLFILHGQAKFGQSNIEFAADPSVSGRIVDLLRSKLVLGPVGALSGLGNTEAEQIGGHIAQSMGLHIGLGSNIGQIYEAGGRKVCQSLETEDVVTDSHTCLDDVRVSQEIAQSITQGQKIDLKDICLFGGGELNQGRRTGLFALLENRAGLCVEAEQRLTCHLFECLGALLLGTHHDYSPLITMKGHLIDVCLCVGSEVLFGYLYGLDHVLRVVLSGVTPLEVDECLIILTYSSSLACKKGVSGPKFRHFGPILPINCYI